MQDAGCTPVVWCGIVAALLLVLLMLEVSHDTLSSSLFAIEASTFVSSNATATGNLSASDIQRTASATTSATKSRSSLVAHDILHTATTAGLFRRVVSFDSKPVGKEWDTQLNFSKIGDVKYVVPPAWGKSVGYLPQLHDALDRFGRDEASSSDTAMLSTLRGKSLLLLGDSTDNNVWSEMCHCRRDKGHVNAMMTGEIAPALKVKCFVTTGPGCNSGTIFESCLVNTLNLTLHFAGAEHSIHPYGKMPYSRAQYPQCTTEDFSSCLKKKFTAACNDEFGFKCMFDPDCGNKQPDIVVFQQNLWFWFRMKNTDERPYNKMAWQDLQAYYAQNATLFIRELQESLPETSVWAVHTAVGTKTPSRVSMPQIMAVNSWIRHLGTDMGIGVVDWDTMLSMNWKRELVLADDMHPLAVFNHAIGNIYLNALASL